MDKRTDGRADERTDGQTDRRTKLLTHIAKHHGTMNYKRGTATATGKEIRKPNRIESSHSVDGSAAAAAAVAVATALALALLLHRSATFLIRNTSDPLADNWNCNF